LFVFLFSELDGQWKMLGDGGEERMDEIRGWMMDDGGEAWEEG
jgi:hypothetical protein